MTGDTTTEGATATGGTTTGGGTTRGATAGCTATGGSTTGGTSTGGTTTGGSTPEGRTTGGGDAVDEGGEAPCFAHLLEERGEEVDDAVLALLVHRLADAVVIADPDGVITFWNEAAEALFGWSAAEAIGRDLDLIIPERQRSRHQAGYQRVMATGRTSYGDRLLEVPALHRDGHTISLAFTVTLLTRPGEQRPFAIAALLRDDTARWQELRELRQRLAVLEATHPGP